MRAIRSKYIPFGRFVAINLFGVVFVRSDWRFSCRAECRTLMVHESIHTLQMRELGYVPFYIWYVLEWLLWLFVYRNADKAYRNISFEREAYAHQHDASYLKNRKRFAFWKGRRLNNF